MKESGGRPNTRSQSNAKIPENEDKRAASKPVKRVVFDGVQMPTRSEKTTRPEKADDRIDRSKPASTKEASGDSPASSRREAEHMIEDFTIDDDDEVELEIVPRPPTPPRINEGVHKVNNRRLFEAIEPLVATPIPRNQPIERREAPRQNTQVGTERGFRLKNSLQSEGLAEQIASRIYDAKIELSERELMGISPEVRKIMIRKAKNQRVKPRTRESAEVYTLAAPDNSGETRGVKVMSKYLDVEDMHMPDEDMFEVLEEDRGSLKAGSIVQRDIVQCFKMDMAPDDERKNMIVVAHRGNGLRSIYPSINGAEADVEATLDSGSQIVSLDRVIAVGLNIPWDPMFTIQMQDVHGGVQRTLGLARNVPFKIGEITVYLQCHVQDRAPYEVLIGRPFDVLTESEVKNWGNGDQEITITDPNSGAKCTIGTYPKGSRPRQTRIDTSRYNQPTNQPQEKEDGQKKDEANFHLASKI